MNGTVLHICSKSFKASTCALSPLSFNYKAKLTLSGFVLCKSFNEISFPKRGTIEDGKSEIDVFVHCVHYI